MNYELSWRILKDQFVDVSRLLTRARGIVKSGAGNPAVVARVGPVVELTPVVELPYDAGNQPRYRSVQSKPRRQSPGSRTVPFIFPVEGLDQFRFLDWNDHTAKHQDADEPQERHEPTAGHQAQRKYLE